MTSSTAAISRRSWTHLTRRHGFTLSADDLEQLETIYFAFFWEGPGLRYSTMASGIAAGAADSANTYPTYEDMITQTDWDDTPRSYLATEENFRFIKGLEEKNLIVPVMGDFAGPKALRAIGRYVRERGSVVSAFYVSNVEQYLFQDGKFDAFARNVATLPVDARSTFIRSVSTRFGYGGTDDLGRRPGQRALSDRRVRPGLPAWDADELLRPEFEVQIGPAGVAALTGRAGRGVRCLPHAQPVESSSIGAVPRGRQTLSGVWD